MKIIDMEAHFYTEDYLKYLKTRKKPPYDEIKGEDVSRWLAPELETHLSEVIDKILCDMGNGRIKDMDAAGIDTQVLSLTVPGVEQFEGSEGIPIAREVNDYLSESIKKYPGRFIGLAALALQDPQGAADELERAVVKLGLKGVNVNSHIGDEYLDNRKYWGILEKAEGLGVPIYIHPTVPSPSMLKHYADYGMALSGPPLGFGAEVSLHAMRLIYSGVFDHYPNLKIILGHLGEALPFWLDRIDFFWQKPWQEKDFKPKNKKKPSDYIKNNFFVTTSGMPFMPAFVATYLALGADRILFATDYPYENSAKTVKSIEAMPICDADKDKIFYLNAESLFRL